ARVPSHLRHRFVCLPFVPADAMPALYARAEATLYPSLYEGFGFPALESQAVGTPVLMSAAGSLRELIGPASIVLPADDFPQWVDAVRQTLTHRPDRLPEARAWAMQFSWRRSVDRLLAVYQQALLRYGQ